MKSGTVERLVISFIFTFVVVGCSQRSDHVSNNVPYSLPYSPQSLLGYCEQAPSELNAAGFKNRAELNKFLTENRVRRVNSIRLKYLVQFAFELKRFPKGMLDYLSTHKVGIRLLEGEGVIEDSTFKPGTDATPDGRPWSTIVGVGTNPTRIVVNHLYDKHGSVNLVLHERAHTLDYYGAVISSSVGWNKIMTEETSFVQLMQKVCGDYCTKNPVEAFAEGFAIYFSCEQSRRLLNDSPLVLAFMKSIEEAQTRDEIGHLTGQSDSLVSVP